MAIYDELHKHYGTASAEQKLVVLRRELLRPILTVQSAARLLEEVGGQIINCLPTHVPPEEFLNTIKWLGEAGGDLKDILDALTEDLGKVQGQHGAE